MPKQAETTMSVAELTAARNVAAKQLAALDDQILAATQKHLTETADRLHTLLCHHNHTDQCAWGYEKSNGIPDWAGPDHSRWLGKAKTLVSVTEGVIDPRDLPNLLGALHDVGRNVAIEPLVKVRS